MRIIVANEQLIQATKQLGGKFNFRLKNGAHSLSKYAHVIGGCECWNAVKK